MTYERSDVEIVGYGGRSIRATLHVSSSESNALAVVLPGLHYTSSMPLLYYSIKALLLAGICVLDVKTDYAVLSEFHTSKRMEILHSDSFAIAEHVEKLEKFELWGIIGKSIGTLLMGLMLEEDAIMGVLNTCWLTPLLHQEVVQKAMLHHERNALVVIGTEDPFYDKGTMDNIMSRERIQAIVVEGADHSLEIPANVNDSIQIVSRVVKELHSFIDSA